MKITTVGYARLNNLGDYQNERIEMQAQLEEGETPEQVLQDLKERVLAECKPSARQLDDRRWDLINEIDKLERKLADYQRKWNAAAQFLIAQGIKPDAPMFPDLAGLLPAAETAVTPEVVDELEATPF